MTINEVVLAFALLVAVAGGVPLAFWAGHQRGRGERDATFHLGWVAGANVGRRLRGGDLLATTGGRHARPDDDEPEVDTDGEHETEPEINVDQPRESETT